MKPKPKPVIRTSKSDGRISRVPLENVIRIVGLRYGRNADEMIEAFEKGEGRIESELAWYEMEKEK